MDLDLDQLALFNLDTRKIWTEYDNLVNLSENHCTVPATGDVFHLSLVRST